MTITAQARSAAPPDRLWHVVSDVTSWPTHLETFDEVAEIGDRQGGDVGRRFTVRQPGLPDAVYEVTAWTPGAGFTWVSDRAGIRTAAGHTITPCDGGAEVTLTIDWSGPLAPLVRLLYGRRTRRMIQTEATVMARVAESGE